MRITQLGFRAKVQGVGLMCIILIAMLILGDLALGQDPDSGKQVLQKLAKVMDVDLPIQISADKSQADPGDAIFYMIR